MEEHEVVWPMGLSNHDPSLADRPWRSTPRDSWSPSWRTTTMPSRHGRRCRRLGSPITTCGSTSQQILADHQRYPAQRSLTRRVVGGLTNDTTALERYLDRAPEGHAALWVHVPDDADAKQAVRLLADHPVIHLRHYGQDRQEDLHLR